MNYQRFKKGGRVAKSQFLEKKGAKIAKSYLILSYLILILI